MKLLKLRQPKAPWPVGLKIKCNGSDGCGSAYEIESLDDLAPGSDRMYAQVVCPNCGETIPLRRYRDWGIEWY